MKSLIRESKDKPRFIEFPMLMKSKLTGIIVLFYNVTEGAIVSIKNPKDYFSGRFDINDYEVFTGEVILSNF